MAEEKSTSYPLHKAIRYRIIPKIKILLTTNNNINKKNDFGKPPLIYACEQEENDHVLEILFQQENIDPLVTDDEQQNAVHILAFKGQLQWIKRFFEKFPDVPVDAITNKYDTALIIAAKMNHVNVIEYLFKKGANVNHTNNKNFTALHYAANNGRTESVKKLIDLGAHVNVFDDRGCTPLMKCCSWGFVEPCKILLTNGAETEPRARPVHYTALIQAIQRGHLEIVKTLLENGADPNYSYTASKNILPYTPLGAASAKKNTQVMEMLIKSGVNVNDQRDLSLFICIKNNFEKGVRILIEAGVDLHRRHIKTGKTAYETANDLHREQILQLIQRHM